MHSMHELTFTEIYGRELNISRLLFPFDILNQEIISINGILLAIDLNNIEFHTTIGWMTKKNLLPSFTGIKKK